MFQWKQKSLSINKFTSQAECHLDMEIRIDPEWKSSWTQLETHRLENRRNFIALNWISYFVIAWNAENDLLRG